MSPAELLAPHAKRKIRAFLNAPDPGNHRDSNVFDAFWSLIYGDRTVDHAIALAVERELAKCDRRVGDVLAGWRPLSLAQLGLFNAAGELHAVPTSTECAGATPAPRSKPSA